MTFNLIRKGKIMCQYCEEDRPTISCDFTIVDSEGNTTSLSKTESLYYEHELSQILNWFKLLLISAGYDTVIEVKAISSLGMEESSED